MRTSTPTPTPSGLETESDVTATGGGAPLLAAPLALGSTIGRYVIIGKLGTGGMGVVHAAYDPELDRKLAIKLLHPLASEGRPRVQARLLREAQAIAKLAHPNVVAVHDVGVHEGRVFVAMEFVEGGTLAAWLRARRRGWRELLGPFVGAGRGLAAAHAAGFVHRDFKPANVLLGSDGRPRVADFGIARSTLEPKPSSPGSTSSDGPDEAASEHANEASRHVASGHTGSGSATGADAPTGPSVHDVASAEHTLTQTGALLGTPAYMAPEQFIGAEVDARADQFGFCVALYEALYGQRPFAGESVQALMFETMSGRLREPPRGHAVPSWLHRIVVRGLASRAEERWPDMNALLHALERGPGRTRRIASFALLGTISTSFVAIALLGVLAAEPEPADSQCTLPDDALAQTWSPALREAVANQLVGEAGEGVLPRLDAWADEWRAAWVDACEATNLRGEQSSELLDLRMVCLERQRRRVAAYVVLLRDADPTLARKALDGLDELATPSRCSDRAALLALPLPEDPEQRARVAALASALDQVFASLVAGDWALAQRGLEPLGPAIAAERWRPLSAELAFMRGELHRGKSEREPGELEYRSAIVDALAVGDERLAAEAMRGLAELIAEWETRHAEALEQLRTAEALADHLDDAGLRGEIELTRASVLEQRGEFEAGLAAAERASAALVEAHGEGSPLVANARYRASMLLYRLGRIDEAKAWLDRARAGWGAGYGPTHPVSLQLVLAGALLAGAGGDWARAERGFADLLALKEAMFGPDHLDVSDALANLGAAQTNAGNLEGARTSLERALVIRERELGPDNLYVGHTLANLSAVYSRLGRFEQAIDASRRALAILVTTRGERHHDTMVGHAVFAEVLESADQREQALGEFELALELAGEVGSPSQQLEFRLQIARVQILLERFDAARAQLDAAQALMGDEAQVVPLHALLYEYLRARLADHEGDSAGADFHAALARAKLEGAQASGIAAVAEAEAWLASR